ncbi:hypothetical protein ACWGH8_11720 [Nonomuraea muscovyensis]|uniref:Uncharacterized protein n=1 Tax=Nonomuraea muscovyensis TaxID=1124761 RepID=A0A7X0C8T0_9ACTN|nr:hypothetical protein [Nonomuraea muscovyensis]MBB6350665.1 hypothetical protein [Nonomuraea muscovyensis]
MPDIKDTGTTMYTTALGLTVYSATAFGPLAAISTTIIGTLYSSPSDIQDASNAWRSVVPKLDAFKAKLDTVEKDVPEEDWKEMSRPEFQQVKKDFLARKDDSKVVYTGVADVLGGLSGLSLAAAVFSLVGASGMAMWATTIYLTRWNAALALGGQATGNMYVQAFTNGLKVLATKQRKAMLISAGVAVGAASLLASQKAQELTKQATPENAPDFTQVYLEGLPQEGMPGTAGLPRTSPSTTTRTSDTTSDTTDDTTVQAPGAPSGTVAT